MSLSFSINAKSQSNRLKKPTASFADAAAAPSDSSARNYVTEFSAKAPPPPESKIKPIEPNTWPPNKKLKNLPDLSQPNDSVLQFEVDTGGKPEAGSDTSMGYGLNIRQRSAEDPTRGHETIAEMELRRLREDLEKLSEEPGMDDYDDVPVESFALAVLSRQGWKEGRGIGRNAKEDVKVYEIKRKAGKGGLGFTGELPENRLDNNGKKVENGEVERKRSEDQKEKKGFDVGKEVRVVHGKEFGTVGKIVEVRHGGDTLVLRISRSNEKVKVQSRAVAMVGSAEEEKCVRMMKELKTKEKDDINGEKGKKQSRKRGHDEKSTTDRVNWLRNNIRVRVVSEELKNGRLFLSKGMVVDVVGPGVCDISMDGSRELVQGVDQDLLETALPKRGGPVIVLYGRHKGVYGSLLERDSDKETGVVQDADTREIHTVRLEQIAEYTGDPSDIGY
ncbi:protein MOS2-like [Andrographis paniculata]|uniref:protein MOS2-like n=1 Tax=Andrographis paniculata TaxID=175694 RepID=UPI0021E7A4F5|nr:protein MOS2-like [Andrographis paniculata]